MAIMRLKSAIWVAAYVRRCHIEGAFAAVRRRGAEEAGAIFIKLNRLDGTAELFGPAPQSSFEEAHPTDRAFARSFGGQAGISSTPSSSNVDDYPAARSRRERGAAGWRAISDSARRAFSTA